MYNKKKYISRAVNSVLKQIYTNFELIVIDDGSTDNGANEVQKNKDNRIKIIHQNNQGVSAARNRGIDEAKGELVAFLDADDEWKHNFLVTIITLREKYPQAGAFATAYEFNKVATQTQLNIFENDTIEILLNPKMLLKLKTGIVDCQVGNFTLL